MAVLGVNDEAVVIQVLVAPGDATDAVMTATISALRTVDVTIGEGGRFQRHGRPIMVRAVGLDEYV